MTRLRRASVIAALFLLAWTPQASAQERASPEAHELARVLLSSGAFDVVMKQASGAATIVVIVAVEGRLRRSLSPDERSELQTVVTQAIKDTLPWDSWEDMYANLYSKYASSAEIKDMLAFYKTPTGRRALSLNVILTTEGAEAGRSLAKSREQEFQKRFIDALGETMPGLKAELERSGQSR